MRVVNVDDIKSRQKQRAKKQKASVVTKRVMLVAFGVIIIGVLAYGTRFVLPRATGSNNQFSSASDETAESNVPKLPDESGKLRSLKGNEFRDLYRSVNYPNTTAFASPPMITGNIEADDRIRELAVARGFILTAHPTTSIRPADDELVAQTEDNLLQPLAFEAWRQLEKEAQAASMPLKLSSAYRSVERQRELFMERLLATGVTVDQIAAGSGDDAVETTLYMTAPPGFSRHHTGYTIDLVCDNELTAFQGSMCDIWLQKNEYEIPKQLGWIPSYPAEADSQGPEPEPWEYVWVGTRHLHE